MHAHIIITNMIIMHSVRIICICAFVANTNIHVPTCNPSLLTLALQNGIIADNLELNMCTL